MGFFRKQQSSDMPPLVEEIKGGEPIIFDDEEKRAIDKEIKYQYDNFYKDRIFPKDVAETLQVAFATLALRKLAKSKLSSGDLKGAASTCIKLLGLAASGNVVYEGDWVLLAEIFAQHGDIVRAEGFLTIAKKVHKENKNIHEEYRRKWRVGGSFESVWEDMVRKVEGIIRSKQSK